MVHSPAARLVLALGALSAAVLLVAAFVDLGDPVEAARARIAQSVDAQDELFGVAWDRVRRESEAPPAAGVDVVIPLDVDLAAAPLAPYAPPAPSEDPLFDVLLDAAIASGLENDLGSALANVEEALERDPEAPRASEARLAAARWWSGLGATVEVERHRAALAALPVEALVEGTSAQLLAALVQPIDAEGAFALLTEGGAVLPPPEDAWRIADGSSSIARDAWRSALRAPLEDAAPDLDWDAAFGTAERSARAVARGLGGVPVADGDAWSFRDVAGVTVAVRAVDDAVRVVEVDRVALERTVLDAARSGAPGPAHDALVGEAQPRETRTLAAGPGVALEYSVLRPDPVLTSRGEVQRLRLVRGALLGLAVLVLLGAVLSARAMDRARRLAELRSTFVASVSHDLRTPTQAILLMAETLEQDRVATEASRGRYHTQIRREAERLRRLVEDLLDGARIDRGGGARVDRRVLDSAEFFNDLEAAMAERADAAGATLRVVRQSMPPSIEVDPDGVRRVTWNLFENALLHGGSEDRPARVTVEVGVTDGALSIEVNDDGPGVPARYRETIFEPFERLADRKRRDGMKDDTGTGLGLAIVRALSRAHGGDATLEPSDAGARFVATFRIDDEEVVA